MYRLATLALQHRGHYSGGRLAALENNAVLLYICKVYIFVRCESALFHAAVTRAPNAVSRCLLISVALMGTYQQGSPTFSPH